MPGTIRPRTNDGRTTYQARWRPPGDGRDNVRRTKTFKTRREANRWLTEQEASAHSGTYVDPRRGEQDFAVVAKEWVATKTHLEPRTHADYEGTINTWFTGDTDPLGNRPPFRSIGSITTGSIENWLLKLADKRSHRTMAKVYGVLSQITAFAARRGYIAIDPCGPVKLPPKPRADYDPNTGEYLEDEAPSITILSKADITKLAGCMPNATYATAITFDAWMGLRAGELWALKRKDVDLLHGVVHVRRAWKEVNGSHRGAAKRYFLGPLKTRAGRRSIHMPEHIKQLITAHLDANPSLPDAYVFTQPDGSPVRQSRFYKKVFKPAVRAALPENAHLRFHDLRHTAASFILAVHPNLFLVMKRLGHASYTTTTQTYGHLVGDVDAMLATALDDFARRGRSPAARPADSV